MVQSCRFCVWVFYSVIGSHWYSSMLNYYFGWIIISISAIVVKAAAPSSSLSSLVLQSWCDEDVIPHRLPTHKHVETWPRQGYHYRGIEPKSVHVLDEISGTPVVSSDRRLKPFCTHEKIEKLSKPSSIRLHISPKPENVKWFQDRWKCQVVVLPIKKILFTGLSVSYHYNVF